MEESRMIETTPDRIAPIRKSIAVRWPPEEAFRRFTGRIGEWWPLETHSVSGSAAASCAIEPRLGGRIVETAPDGTEHLWGTVTAWEPPDRLAFTWHPGRTADTRQEVEITFLPVGNGARVSLVHFGWERLGERAAEVRRNYEGGWGIVLGRYAD